MAHLVLKILGCAALVFGVAWGLYGLATLLWLAVRHDHRTP